MSQARGQYKLDLHGFAEGLLLAAGGERVENLLPQMPGRKRADVAFIAERTVIEIKSLTNDRGHDPGVKKALSRLIAENGPAMGGPIIFGDATVRLDKLPSKLATNAFRLLGNRVRREVTAANRQIKETIEDLGWEDAQGIALFIVPPMKIDLHLIGWTVNDAIRGRQNSSINSLVMIECDAPDERTRNLVISQHSIAGVGVPAAILIGIQSAIRQLLNMDVEKLSEEDFFRRFEIDPF
jgi:hypothetical protein